MARNVVLQVMKKNAREREEERNEPEVIDSQMLWLLMHTLRRNAARRVSHLHCTLIVTCCTIAASIFRWLEW